MRYVILGTGAIGGVIGGKLALAGHDVTLVARGPHLEAIRSEGLELRDPDRTDLLHLPTVGSPGEAALAPGDCVILATKTQQSEAALEDLRAAAGAASHEVAVVCAQNGVENERMALRRFPRVYGMRVIIAGTHLELGVVAVATSPVYGVLDVGRYPSGSDALADALAADLKSAGFEAVARADVMPYKYLKLLSNLGNALQAASGTAIAGEPAGSILRAAREEARRCFEAAGIAVADEDGNAVLRRLRGDARPIGGADRQGGSSWQSLVRGTGNIESDYLNGEIVLLGRLHGVATPVNERLQAVADRLARERQQPGSVPVEEIAAGLPL